MVGSVLKAGYLVLVFMAVLLFSLSFIVAINEGALVVAGIIAVVIAALLYEKKREWITNLAVEKIQNISFTQGDVMNSFSLIVGALAAYTLSVNFELGAVVGSALVGIFVALIIPKYGVPTYCGAFVGMSSAALLPNQLYVLLAAVIAAALFSAAKVVFNGFGGKLGTIAWTGAVGAALLTGQELMTGSVPGGEVSALILFYGVIGAVLTRVISIRLKHGPVMGSAIVVLAAGLLLPVIHPEVGMQLAVMVTCATYAGMSSAERIPNEAYMALAGLIAGMIFIFSQPFIQGAGGKLGTTAFGSVIAVRGMMVLVKQAAAKRSKEQTARVVNR